MLVNQLQHMTPPERFGFLLLWYALSYWTAIKYAQQWFHIPPYMETPSWMQCQSSWHCPKWHNCHTAGSNKTLLLSRTTCIASTCIMHAAHICCTCNTSNPDETGSSCSCHTSCSKECPSTNACDTPCHTCAATKIWLCLHGTKMPDPGNLGTIDLDCPQTLLWQCTTVFIPSKLLCCVSYSQKVGCCIITHFISQTDPLVSWSCFAVYINRFSHILSHMSSGYHRAWM